MSKLTSDEIAGLDAIHARHGRKWRNVVELDWYRGTDRNIGNAVYCLRNRVGGLNHGLDAYAQILRDRKKAAKPAKKRNPRPDWDAQAAYDDEHGAPLSAWWANY